MIQFDVVFVAVRTNARFVDSAEREKKNEIAISYFFHSIDEEKKTTKVGFIVVVFNYFTRGRQHATRKEINGKGRMYVMVTTTTTTTAECSSHTCTRVHTHTRA